MRKTLTLICLPLLTLASCQDTPDGPTLAIYSDIVTFTGNSSQGATFEYRQIDDSPTVTLAIDRATVDESKTAPGTRLLMTYSLPEGTSYGTDCNNVQLRSLQLIYTDTVRTVPSPTIADMQKIGLLTLYRSGHYLNFTAFMPAVKARKYFMVADKATLNSDTVELYLSTFVKDNVPSYNSTQTGSVDISPVWNLPTVKAIKVNVDNSHNPNFKKFTFIK